MKKTNKKLYIGVAVIILIVGLFYYEFVPRVSGTPSARPDTSGSTQVQPPSSGQTTTPGVNPGFQPDPSVENCKLTGYLKSAYSFHKKNIGVIDSGAAPVSFQFVVTNECEANIYVEAGIKSTSLSPATILVTQPSACDGNPHYAGKFLKGSKNTKFNSNQPAGVIDLAFFPNDYGKEGSFTIVGGVYTKCMKDGGVVVDEIPPQSLSIKQSYSITDINSAITRIV